MRAERRRLSAATRNASERGEWLELESDAATTILEHLPTPDPTEAADLLLEYIGRHSRPGGKTVHLDRRRDYPLIYADGENEFLFILRALHDKGWVERTDKTDKPQYRLTMDGYERLRVVRASKTQPQPPSKPLTSSAQPLPKYDVFLSHASEDTDAIAHPLYLALVDAGVTVWFDKAVLAWGDSLRAKIDDGLAHSRYGIVILSTHFLEKPWPQLELDGLVARETSSGEKAILPVWHNLTTAMLAARSPTLAARLAIRSDEGVPRIVSAVLQILGRPATDVQVSNRAATRTRGWTKQWLEQEARFRARGKVSGIWMRASDTGAVTWNVAPMAGATMDDVGRFRAEAILAGRLLADAGLVALSVSAEDDWLNAVRELTPSASDMHIDSRENGREEEGRAIEDLAERSAYACALLAGGATLARS